MIINKGRFYIVLIECWSYLIPIWISGLTGLYRGIATNIASSAPISALYTFTYESVKGAILPLFPKVPDHYFFWNCCISCSLSFFPPCLHVFHLLILLLRRIGLTRDQQFRIYCEASKFCFLHDMLLLMCIFFSWICFLQEYCSLAHCAAGGSASIATSFIFTPSEHIKQQMQVGSHYPNCWY